MNERTRFDKFLAKYPHPHHFFFQRPHWTRRHFFQMLGAGVTGSFLAEKARANVRIDKLDVKMINKAKHTIFVLLTGAPSHVDTFDLKVIPNVTPAAFNATKINGVDFPAGLMPKLAAGFNDIAILRSVRSWNLQHGLGQLWQQIGRNPTAALGDIAPNLGSIIAIEKDAERAPTQVFPTFLALNAQQAAGAGYLAAAYGPFKVTPSTRGLPNTTNADGQARVEDRWTLLNQLDSQNRVNSQYGKGMEDMDTFYKSAKGLMYNPVVTNAFGFTTAESAAYGNSGFGNACLVAGKVLAARQGTRFIQINFGSWDHHQNIYAATNLPRMAGQLDAGLGQLIADLKANGMFEETLIVVAGEFGRTVGNLTAQQGRDHFLQQFCVMAGAGIKGGRALGATNAQGSSSVEFGWSRERDVRPEDIEATIYSAMGVNWTSIRYDDPFSRGFEYVPYAHEDLYGPVNELWS